MECVNVTIQAELDQAVANGNISVCIGNGYFIASDNATVEALGNATVEASGNATVRASKYVAVHRYGTIPKVTGGVLIQIPPLDNAENFFDFYGVDIKKGKVIVYKLLDENFVSGHGTKYEPGTSATCLDWNPCTECGGGLHFSPRPFMAHKYSDGTQFVACEIEVDGTVIIDNGGGSKPDKLKAKSCKVLYECDADGKKV